MSRGILAAGVEVSNNLVHLSVSVLFLLLGNCEPSSSCIIKLLVQLTFVIEFTRERKLPFEALR